jgi:alanine dehydrogenase
VAIQKILNSILYGASGDTKPTVYANNTLFFEQDTGTIYRWNSGGSSWDILVGASKTETLTNKTIAAGSNTISGIVDANIGTHTTSKITTTSKSLLNSAIVYNDQANVYGDFDQTIRSARLKVANPANTFNYVVTGSAIAADRTLTLPLLTGADQVTTDAFTTTLTNKTVNATNNTITDTSQATGDILRNNGSKFVRLARGSANQVLQTNSGGTDIAWATISSYTEGKGSSTKSGDASTTAFTIAHGLGGTPTWFNVEPTSIEADSDIYLTADGTNITVTYNFAPPTGTSNLTYVWRAAL